MYPNGVDDSRPQILSNLPDPGQFIVSYGLNNDPKFALYELHWVPFLNFESKFSKF